MAFGDTYGYCGVRGQQWRYNTLFRSRDGALSNTIEVPNGAVSDQYSGSPLWSPGLSKQIINSLKYSPTERASSRPPASPSATTSTSTSCPSRTGTATDGGRRTSRGSRSRRTTVSTGVSIRTRSGRPRRTASTGSRTSRATRTSNRGRSSSRAPVTPTSIHSGHRPDAAVRRTYRGSSPQGCQIFAGTNTGVRPPTPGFPTIRGLRRR